MAKVGAGAAGSQLKRVGNYIAPQINKSADRLDGAIQQQKVLDDTKKARGEKRLDESLADITVDQAALQSKATGFVQRDDVFRAFAGRVSTRSEEHATAARKAALDSDWGLVANLKGKMNRLKGDFKNTVNDEAILAKRFAGYEAKFAAGDIDDEDFLNFGVAVEKFDFEIVLDENDNKIVRALVEADDGSVSVMDKKWSELVNMTDRPYEVVHMEDRSTEKGVEKGLVSNLLATMGKRKYDSTGKNYTTTTQKWDDTAETQFMQKVIGLQSDDRSMYSLLKQATRERKKTGFTTEDKNEVEKMIRNQVKGGYGEETTIEVAKRTATQLGNEEDAKNEVTKRGHDITAQRDKDTKENESGKLDLAWWKAKNPVKAGKGGTATKEELTKSSSVLAYEIAMRINNVGDISEEGITDKMLDKLIVEIGEEYGLNLSENSDWWGGNEFNMSGEEFDQKDPHSVARAIAEKMGYVYDSKHAQAELTKKLSKKDEPKADKDGTITLTAAQIIEEHRKNKTKQK